MIDATKIIRCSTFALLLSPLVGGEKYCRSFFDTNNFNFSCGDDFDSNTNRNSTGPTIMGLNDPFMATTFGIVAMLFDGFDLESMAQHPSQTVENRCSANEAATFNGALDEFKICSGFDLRSLIDTFASSVYHDLVSNCGDYFVNYFENDDSCCDLVTKAYWGLKQHDTPFPRVSPKCVDAIAGEDLFKLSQLYLNAFSEGKLKCFADLSTALPTCTPPAWGQLPHLGNWLQAIASSFGSLDQTNDLSDCSWLLDSLSNCLFENKRITEASCRHIRSKCIFDVDDAVPAMLFPQPFWARPITQRCKNFMIEADPSVLDWFETFRNVCIPAADRALWDNSTSQMPKTEDIGGAAEEKSNNASKEADPPSLSSSNFVAFFFWVPALRLRPCLGSKG
eukprot:scaffold3716_cov69-Cylindrotheca_fusiformis.AAC.5